LNDDAIQDNNLEAYSKKRNILIGTAVRDYALKKDGQYSSIVSKEFNVITPENEMKFSVVHPKKYLYDFSEELW
jgi:endo-1,4-beta-xylanase